ncbi:MAG TPA: serine/threonine-protein kinase [Polyangiaceae bacterium]|jgi:serine/threonine-protein kinase|nr:serine/threonine-protein kinase [Polyangiaceae bacterium]
MADDDELLVRARARVGAVLRGKYRLDGVLGRGGMSVVYAATHRNKKRFAVKVLHPELSLHPEIRARFLREGYAANSVDHPGAVAVLDDDIDDDGAAFLVMELLDGETAEDMLVRSNEKLPVPLSLAVAYHALDVLAQAHAHGVVHRDVKPANLFLTRRGELKLLDFGVARVRDAASSRNTQAGAIMGTAAFMAPEQALGKTEDVDALTDVWAVGATVYNMVSGRCVHEGSNAQETIVLAATRPAGSLEDVLPDAPRPVVEVIDRALAFDKAKRWSSAAAMRDALREASIAAFGRLAPLPSMPDAGEAGGTVFTNSDGPLSSAFSTISRLSPAVAGRRKGRRAAVVVAGLAIAALAVVVFLPRHAPTPDRPAAAAVAAVATPPPVSPPSAIAPAAPDTTPVAAPSASARPVMGSAASTKSPAGSRAAPPASGPAHAKCNPPFYFDGQGNRVFKKECL